MRVIFSLLLAVMLNGFLTAEESLGYITYSTMNIGDDIQALAAKRFLPPDAISIDREFVSEFTCDTTVNTIMNGWFMYHKDDWPLPLKRPVQSWPPSSFINPLFISFHTTKLFLPLVFSEKNIEYLKNHAPIGARDLFTLGELQKRGIPSYFSGCLTLTLENPYTERNEIVYLVDLDKECVKYIKSKTSSPIVEVTHIRSELQKMKPEARLKSAEDLLNLYRQAKCVVTTRLHAAMPCLAFETPVLMISSSQAGAALDIRFTGLVEHTFHGSKEQLLKGELDFDFDHPPENPQTHLPLREDLILTMEAWIQSCGG